MDLRAFLALLDVRSGPSAKGEYLCRCPAHDDRNASLCVKDGEKGIVLKCQAGCTTERVLTALDLKLKDLFPAQAQLPGHRVLKAKQLPEPQKHFDSYAAAYGYIGTFECAYVYRDAKGTPLFEVARIQTTAKDGSPSKTFRQHRLVGPNWTFPLEKTVPDALKDTLYRLPEVRKAIAEGQTVYVVEGEKDADNLGAHGLVATTNVMGAEKWRQAHSEHLSGAKVCILPDNDEPGQKHARLCAESIARTAQSVKVLDLTLICPGLPKKGDISDALAMLGADATLAALRRLEADTKPIQPDPSASDLPEALQRATTLYGQVFGYCIAHGRICQTTQDGPKPLCNFVALPHTVVTRDDGVNVSKEMVIDGWTQDGRALPRVQIKANQFQAMSWVTENWDFSASIMPGNTAKDKLRYVIAEVGRTTATRTTEYSHTGWRKIHGKWAYLYQGGAIGAEGVTVDLGSGLGQYRLDGSGAEGYANISLEDGILASRLLTGLMAEHVALPLLGTIFLAPLREFLVMTGIAPAYALFLLGGTGTRKSTAVALALSHFGNFTSKSLPASFNDTSNFIRKKAFLLKDMPIAVDDYHPVTNLQERKRMEGTAQSLARAFGDGAERGRMKSDLTLQEAMPPRGLAIISGEDTPGVGESGLARFYVVNVSKEDVPISSDLTDMQEMARQGYLQRCMHGYIEWLAKQVDQLPGILHEDFLAYREMAQEKMRGQHSRAPEAIAHMMLGYANMLRFMKDMKMITLAQAETEILHAWDVVTSLSRQQGEEAHENRPCKVFLANLAELMACKAVGVRDLKLGTAATVDAREMIGYKDADYYYLMPEMAYRAIAKLHAEQGSAFPLTRAMLFRQMKEDGLLEPDKSGNGMRGKWIDGQTQRLAWIPRHHIDGPAPKKNEQTRLDIPAGFTQVPAEDAAF